VAAGAVLPNLTVVQLDTTEGGQVGDLDVYNSAGQANLVIDLEGWFQ
jgi:hypothetical protein